MIQDMEDYAYTPQTLIFKRAINILDLYSCLFATVSKHKVNVYSRLIRIQDEADNMLDRAELLSLEGLSSQERVSVRLMKAHLRSFSNGFPYRKYVKLLSI